MRPRKSAGLGLIWLTLAGGIYGQSPEETQFAGFREKVKQDILSVPNYTCLETIDREHRAPHTKSFKPVDTVRLEVSSVAGKELFAWPGARHFEDRNANSMVTGGVMGTGMFAQFAHRLFVTGMGTPQYGAAEKVGGQSAIRYDFHVTPQDSSVEITSNGATDVVAAKGSFWFSAASLDLLRLEVQGESIPYRLRLEDAVFATNYARVRIGDLDALLPKQSDLTLTHFTGEASRASIAFSQCREYRTESTISFDAPATPVVEAPKPAVRELSLPAGLAFPIELETAIDSKTATVGDMLKGRVTQEVRIPGDLKVPAGARITGQVRKLDRRTGGLPFALGIGISEVEWEGYHAAFNGELVDVDRKSAGTRKPVTYFDGHNTTVLIERGLPGVGVFYIGGGAFRIPSGLRMVWRTVAAPAANRGLW